MTTLQPKSEELRALYWRDEILQVMFWLKGEGFGERLDPGLLQRFLGVDAAIGIQYLNRMVEEGFLRRTAGERYELTERGHAEGARIFQEEFSELTKPTHGECGPDCWCHTSLEEAEVCAQERTEFHTKLYHEHSH